MNIPDEELIDEANLLRLENSDYKYEIVLRKKALTGILNQVGHNFVSSQKGIDIGNEIPKIIKFKGVKRAISMTDVHTHAVHTE